MVLSENGPMARRARRFTSLRQPYYNTLEYRRGRLTSYAKEKETCLRDDLRTGYCPRVSPLRSIEICVLEKQSSSLLVFQGTTADPLSYFRHVHTFTGTTNNICSFIYFILSNSKSTTNQYLNERFILGFD